MDDLGSIRRSLRVLVVVALLGVAYFSRDVILPVVLGFLLALTLSPLSRGMHRIGIPHAISAFSLVSATALTVVMIIGASAGTVAMWSDEIPKMGYEIREKLSVMSDAVEDVRSVTKEVENISGDDDAATQKVVVEQPGLLDSAFNTVTKIGAAFAVTMVLAVFLLSSGELFYLKLVQAFPTMEGKKRALTTVYNIERRVSHYLLTITLINAGLGVTVGIYLALLGLPNALIWGVAVFLFNFLPYIGGFFGSLLVAGYAIVTFDSLGYALLAPLGYQVLTAIEGQFVTPWILGRRLALNTVAVFLTVVFWAWLWGVAGALVAVPFLVVFKVICENFEPLQTIGNFLSGEDDDTASAKRTAPVVSPGE